MDDVGSDDSATSRSGLQTWIDLGAPTESLGLSLPLHAASFCVSISLCAVSNSLLPVTNENAACSPKSLFFRLIDGLEKYGFSLPSLMEFRMETSIQGLRLG